tara:strand:- start:599 stop:1132 length:534 start_codon:yes stop_codon:yes gene_type:complete
MGDMKKGNLLNYIRTVPDYPVEGVNFYDLNSLFSSTVWPRTVEKLADDVRVKFCHPTHIVGIESRGFVVGAALAQIMSLPFTMIRKKGAKYPGELLEESYELEYGTDTLTLQVGILGHTSRVILVDDLVATGGSIQASKKLCEQTGAQVLGVVSLIHLAYLNRGLDMTHVTGCEVKE